MWAKIDVEVAHDRNLHMVCCQRSDDLDDLGIGGVGGEVAVGAFEFDGKPVVDSGELADEEFRCAVIVGGEVAAPVGFDRRWVLFGFSNGGDERSDRGVVAIPRTVRAAGRRSDSHQTSC